MPRLTRYGSPCATCGVLRDYHDLTEKDHKHVPTDPPARRPRNDPDRDRDGAFVGTASTTN